MAQKRLLYFMSRQVRAYRWKGGVLAEDAVFATSEEGVAEFSVYVGQAPEALYYILADVVEEDFHHETIPYVRGKDRRTLLERRLAQRYRDVSLSLTLSLGYETGPRKEERILFSSFTNTQQFQPWLAALRSREARLAGVYSVPLVSPAMARRIGITEKRYLLVSRQTAGMRQSFVDNGHIRFSRLGQIEGTDMHERARRVAAEASRIQQYLVNTRMLPRNAGPLPIVVMVHEENRAAFQAACVDTPQIRFELKDMSQACRAAGLKSAPAELLTERLYLQVLASDHPRDQFAEESHRRFYNLWRARVALLAAGASVFGFCALVSALQLMDTANVKQLTAMDVEQERGLSQKYAQLQAQFPKTPTTRENLKALVTNYQLLQKQNASLERVLVEVSGALTGSPQIELDRIDWRVGGTPKPGQTQPAPAAAPAPPGAAAGKGAPPPADVEEVEISGRVNVAQASDYRNITLLVNQFVDTLGKRPGIEIVTTRLPFDLATEKSVSGSIGTERPTEVPRFSVVFTNRRAS